MISLQNHSKLSCLLQLTSFILVKSLVNGKFNHMLFHVYRYGKIYLKAAKTCMVKGADYAKNEIERLQRLLEKVRLINCLS